MKHCSQCGEEVNFDAKFCHNCGSNINGKVINKSIDANLKVALTNETTEKVIKGVGSGFSSAITSFKNLIKKLVKPVIFLTIIGALITGVVVYVQEAERRKEEAQYQAERKQSEAQAKETITFKKEKAIGSFQIEGMTVNGRFLAYYDGGSGYFTEQYSDSWPYNGGHFEKRPTGRVTISNKKMIIHLDSNRDNKLSNNEKKTFKVKLISKVSNPDYYNYGIIETDIAENVIFVIKNTYNSLTYRLSYKIANDSYELWLK